MAPLADDGPRHVGGLAIEVRPGSPHTRYMIGATLRVAGQLLAEVPVHCTAPNDIAGTTSQRARITAGRLAGQQAGTDDWRSFGGVPVTVIDWRKLSARIG